MSLRDGEGGAAQLAQALSPPRLGEPSKQGHLPRSNVREGKTRDGLLTKPSAAAP